MVEIIMELFIGYFIALMYFVPLIYAVCGDVIGTLMKIFKFKKIPRGSIIKMYPIDVLKRTS